MAATWPCVTRTYGLSTRWTIYNPHVLKPPSTSNWTNLQSSQQYSVDGLETWHIPGPQTGYDTSALWPTVHPFCQCHPTTITWHCFPAPPPAYPSVAGAAQLPTRSPTQLTLDSSIPSIHFTPATIMQWHWHGSYWCQYLPYPSAHSSPPYPRCHSYLSCHSCWHTQPTTTLTGIPPFHYHNSIHHPSYP